MTTNDKAQRATVWIGPLPIDSFKMPDGSYRIRVTSAAVAIGTSRQDATNFLRSKIRKSLQDSGYTPQRSKHIEVDPTGQARGQSRIAVLPLDVVLTFWLYQYSRGNQQTYNRMADLGLETLEQPFDVAFEVERSEDDRSSTIPDGRRNQPKPPAPSGGEPTPHPTCSGARLIIDSSRSARREWNRGNYLNPSIHGIIGKANYPYPPLQSRQRQLGLIKSLPLTLKEVMSIEGRSTVYPHARKTIGHPPR